MEHEQDSYHCNRCGYESSIRCNLLRHLRRTSRCKCLKSDYDPKQQLQEMLKREDGEHQCSGCLQRYKTRQGLWKHLKQCKKRETEAESSYQRLKAELLSDLQASWEQTVVSGNHIHNTNCNNVTLNSTIQINAFRQEEITHLLEDRRFMDTVLKRREKGVLEFIKATYFDRNSHPENVNVRITNYKMPYIDTFDGQRWLKCNKEEVLEDMLDSSCTHIDDHYEDCKDALLEEFSTTFVELIHDFMERVKDRDQHKTFFDALKQRIHLLIINESK